MTVEYDLGGAEEPAPPPDPATVARVRRRRRRAAGLLVAGVVAAVVLIGAPAVATSAVRAPAAGDDGLLDRWYATPPGTPRVQDWPMPAASMLLRDRDGSSTVVSADGSRYARVALTSGDSYPALSDDGTLLAWLSAPSPDEAQVHVLRLSDARTVTRTLRIPGFDPAGLRWDHQVVQVFSGSDTAPEVGEPDQQPDGRFIACYVTSVVSGRTGPLRVTGDIDGSFCDGSATQTVGPPAPALPTSIISSPSAVWNASGDLVQLRPGDGDVPEVRVIGSLDSGEWVVRRYPVTAAEPGRRVSARLLSWPAAGLLVAVETGDGRAVSGELRLVDPDTGDVRVVARSAPGAAGGAVPVAVAPGTVGDGGPLNAVAPSYPWWRPATVAVWARWVRAHPVAQFAAFGVPVFLLGAGLVLLGPARRPEG